MKRIVSIIVVALVVCGYGLQAWAEGHYESTAGPQYGSYVSPFASCAIGWPGVNAGQKRVCVARLGANGVTWQVGIGASVTDSGPTYTYIPLQNPINPIDGGVACFENAVHGPLGGAGGAYLGPEFYAAQGCQICAAGEYYDSTEARCKSPDCDEGQVWDEGLQACRADCAGDHPGALYYDYSTHACATQCPVGKTSNTALRFRGHQVNYDGVLNMNGCQTQAHTYCHADTTPIGDGTTCFVTFEYKEEIPEVMEIQLVQETDGYTDEGAASMSNFHGTAPTVESGGEISVVDLGFADGETVESVQYVCIAGAPKMIVFFEGGGSAQRDMLGTCPVVDGPNTTGVTPGVGAVSDKTDQVLTKIGEVQTAQATADGKQDVAKGLLDDIKGLVEATKEAVEGGGSGGDGGAFDGPATGDPYAQQHESGVGGAVGSGDLGETGLGGYLNALVPNLGSAGPSCPTWTFPAIPVLHTPEFVVDPPCQVWDVIAAMVIAFASFLAYCIVWRV